MLFIGNQEPRTLNQEICNQAINLSRSSRSLALPPPSWAETLESVSSVSSDMWSGHHKPPTTSRFPSPSLVGLWGDVPQIADARCQGVQRSLLGGVGEHGEVSYDRWIVGAW